VVAKGSRQGSGEAGGSETEHAEILALRELGKLSSPPPGETLTLYSTMEPCLMCMGAILIHGIGRIVWAYEDVMGGAADLDLAPLAPLYSGRPVEIAGSVRREESLCLFKAFFSGPGNTYWSDSLLARHTLEQ
jgi:tRNA(adenine34) deaminase